LSGDTFPKDGGGRELCVPIVVRTHTFKVVTYEDMSKG